MNATQTPNPDSDSRTIDTEIVVRGYSPRYVAAGRVVLGIEGGHVNDLVDRGGATNFGVSLRFLVHEGKIDLDGDGLADFDLDMDGDIDAADIAALTKGDTLYLYHRCFWQRMACDSFPRPIGEMLFDMGVNGGITAARKLLQRAINACLKRITRYTPMLVVDGQIGPKTRAALDVVLKHPGTGMPALIVAYRDAAADRYRAIVAANKTQSRFLRGWLTRAANLGKDA